MPYKDSAKKKEYDRKYYQDNKEKNRLYHNEYQKQYRKNNKEKSDKSSRIAKWKSRGLITEDIDKIYERYLSTKECDNCGILLDEDEATKKCMDHSHTTGQFRNILCKVCNTIRIG